MYKRKKINRFIAFLLSFFLALWFLNVYALSSKAKWKILKAFKWAEYKLLFESDNLFLNSESRKIFNASKKYELYKWIREKVQNKREFLENENNKIINKLVNLKESVKILDKEIANIREETVKINNQIIELKRAIKIKNRTILLLKKKIKTNKEILYKYIVYLYKKWNYIFKDWEIDNLKTIFFSWDDIASTLNDLHFKWLIELTWKKLIEKHRKYINNLYIEQISLKKSEKETKALRKQLIVKKAVIKQKKEFKEKLIQISKWKQKVYQNFIEDKLKIEKKIRIKEFIAKLNFKKWKKQLLEKEWCNFVDFSKVDLDKIKLSDKCRQLNSIIYIESKLKWFERDDNWNIFEWPIETKNLRISTYFHDNWYIRMFWEDHDAIDIPAKQWTEIKAPADAYVIYIQKPTKKWYWYIALKHSDWFVTVYWHISSVLVKDLEIIKKWEVFAKTWWTPWTLWAWPMTTWPHLHFEVWKEKKLVDPVTFLNISKINTENLPSIYFSKYKKDYKARTWNEFKWKLESKRKSRTFKITWNNEIERQKNFLRKYWVWWFKNWSLWVEEGIEASIDPTFLMCVWLAETWLWKNLKTPYNIWNVWNTDSWETKTFSSEREWITAMTRTFNNKYLMQYNELKMLSRYWNLDETKPIYASSSSNWHNNIVTCMSYIKGRYISDSYNFRLK